RCPCRARRYRRLAAVPGGRKWRSIAWRSRVLLHSIRMCIGDFGPAPDQLIGKQQFCTGHVIERQFNDAGFHGKTNLALRGPEQAAPKALAPIEGPGEFDPRLKAAEAVVVVRPHQRAIDPWRTDFEHVSTGDRVDDV